LKKIVGIVLLAALVTGIFLAGCIGGPSPSPTPAGGEPTPKLPDAAANATAGPQGAGDVPPAPPE